MIKQKDTLDRFYTKDIVAENCIYSIKHLLDKVNSIVEPSAGGGAFIRALQDYDVTGYDLEPTFEGIIRKNWFDVKIAGNITAIVGNPPFGVRNSLSKGFIKHAVSFDSVEMVAMILPNSWEKHTLQNTVFTSEWKLVLSERLPLDSFEYRGEDYKVPCTFQTWVRGSLYTGEKDLRWGFDLKKSHKDFEVIKEGDYNIFLMGASPKTLKSPSEVTKNNRGYKLKANIPITDLITNLNKIPWDTLGKATAGGGVYWITLPELIKYYSLYND